MTSPDYEGDKDSTDPKNVSESFIRKQVVVADHDNFVYRMDVSTDGGRSWNEGQIEMTFRRSEPGRDVEVQEKRDTAAIVVVVGRVSYNLASQGQP